MREVKIYSINFREEDERKANRVVRRRARIWCSIERFNDILERASDKTRGQLFYAIELKGARC